VTPAEVLTFLRGLASALCKDAGISVFDGLQLNVGRTGKLCVIWRTAALGLTSAICPNLSRGYASRCAMLLVPGCGLVLGHWCGRGDLEIVAKVARGCICGCPDCLCSWLGVHAVRCCPLYLCSWSLACATVQTIMDPDRIDWEYAVSIPLCHDVAKFQRWSNTTVAAKAILRVRLVSGTV
jgi:hypothetical protein